MQQMSRVSDVNYPFDAGRTFRQIRRLIEMAKEMESDGLEQIDLLSNLLMQRKSVEEIDLVGSLLASFPEFQSILMAEIDTEVTSVFSKLLEMVIHCQNVCAELEKDLNTANWHSENQVEKSSRLATPFWPAVDQLKIPAFCRHAHTFGPSDAAEAELETVSFVSTEMQSHHGLCALLDQRSARCVEEVGIYRFANEESIAVVKLHFVHCNFFNSKQQLLIAMIEDLDGPQEQLAHSDVITVEQERLDTPDRQNFKCRFCGLVYNYLSTLKAHERVHDVEEPYVCAKCGLSFRFYSELQTHSEEHKGTYTYKCGCGRSFAKYTDLLYHKHDSDEEDEPVEETVLAEKKPAYQGKCYPDPRNAYYCQFCCRGYKTSHELKYHLYSHRGERAFTVGSSRYLMNRM
ncbi:Zinc finger protein [Trichinella pseudospiralis]